MAVPTIVEAMDEVFGEWFAGSSWDSWKAVLKAAYGLSLDDAERTVVAALTGRERPPGQRVKELWIIASRRSGKTLTASLQAVYAAVFTDFSPYLQRGEKAVVCILSVDRTAAKVALDYIRGFFELPLLRDLVVADRADGLELSNGVVLEVFTNDYRKVRGRTVAVAILDECSFWRDERSARPDVETYRALQPAQATLPGSLIIAITTPYRQAGLAFEKFRDHFGSDRDDILVVRAPSRALNPTIPQSLIDQAVADDPAAASAEWLGAWRLDIAGFLPDEWIDAAIVDGRHELPPRCDLYDYQFFTDGAGGAPGGDAWTLAGGHAEGDQIILDVLRGRPGPFDPSDVCEEYASVIKEYGCSSVVGDRYSSKWIVEAFAKHGIEYVPSELDKSKLYLEVEPLFARGNLELLDHKTLATELRRLERRTMPGGRDRVDHSPSGRDDYANSALGFATLLAGQQPINTDAAMVIGQLATTPDGTPALPISELESELDWTQHG